MESLCVYCFNSFEAKRNDALYCSQACRQNAYLDKRIVVVKDKAQKSYLDGTVEYKPRVHHHRSHFLDLFWDFEEGEDANDLSECLNHKENASDYQVALYLRCLVECLLLFSERGPMPVLDCMELCNAYTALINSPQFKKLNDCFPYKELILNHQQRLYKIASSNLSEGEIIFRIKVEEKVELIIVRYLLATYVPKIKFSELNVNGQLKK